MNRMTRHLSALAVFVIALLACCTSSAFAGGVKSAAPRPMANFSLSKEFYLTFPENLHEGTGPLDLTCFIASNYKAKGVIELLGPGKTTVWKQNWNISDTQGVVQIMIPHGFNNSCEIQELENEIPLRKAIHITSDEPIVVYGLDHWPFTTDGYLAIPPGAWGTEYRVASYYGITRTNELPTVRATSQFAVVAAYDNTTVNIILTDNTMVIKNGLGVKSHDKGSGVSVLLNKGQVYQMQALKQTDGSYNDLSGTIITSSKPIGVLGGVKCTDVPATKPACDNILEMFPPTDTWGKEYFTYPFEPGRTAGDLWRVFPLEKGTDVFINGALAQAQISPFDPVTPYFETDNLQRPELRTAAHWTFNKPVLMCQYIVGQTYDNSDHGDPSFVVLETREEFETGVLFATPPDSNGFKNYINVMISDTATNSAGVVESGLKDSLYLDGKAIGNLPSGSYLLEKVAAIPFTKFYALHISIPGGVHRLKSKSIFSGYAVGLKNFESYAWACALALKKQKPLDTIPPRMSTILTCGELRDTLFDLPADDTIRANLGPPSNDRNGIGWLYETGKDSTYNFDTLVFAYPDSFIVGDSLAWMHIKVTNLRNNAHGALHAVDLAGNDTILYFDYIADTITATPLVRLFGKVNAGTTKTDNIVIGNPLTRPVKVDSIWLATNTLFKIISWAPPTTFPFTMQPGEKRTINIKYSPLVDGFDEDTLLVKFDCFTRPLARVVGGSGTPCAAITDIDFGTLSLPVTGTNPDSLSVMVISNPGSDTLIITKITGPAAPFSYKPPTLLPTPGNPIRIAPGEVDTLWIDFAPTTKGTYRDQVVLTDDAGCASKDNIGDIVGVAESPGPAIIGHTWPATRVACSSTDNGFTVSNTSPTTSDSLIDLKLTGGNIGDFVISNPPTAANPIRLAPSSSVPVKVTFTPSDTGYRWAIAQATFGSGAVFTDTMLRGTGVHPKIFSEDVDFGSQNVGMTTDGFAYGQNVSKKYVDLLGLRKLIIGGADATNFTLIGPSVVPAVLNNGGDTLRFPIRFAPTAARQFNATLTITHDGTFGTCKGDTDYTIKLTGLGVQSPITISPWNDTVFITQVRQGYLLACNPTTGPITINQVSFGATGRFVYDLAKNKPFPITLGAGECDSLWFKFTPLDTVTYLDTMYCQTTAGVIPGLTQGTGKVVVYTAVVPFASRGAFGTEAVISLSVPNDGFMRPSPSDPGTPAPLDSGAMSSLRVGLQFDNTVVNPFTADAKSFDLVGSICPTYTVTRVPLAALNQMQFDIAAPGGVPILKDKGVLGNFHLLALFSATAGSQLLDTVIASQPWVVWRMAPGWFYLDSICGLGTKTGIHYVGKSSLAQSIPNPATTMNGVTSVGIPFVLDNSMSVRLSVYNAMGSEVARLVDGELQKGTYVVPLDIKTLPPGVYYYRLASEGDVQTKTMMIMH